MKIIVDEMPKKPEDCLFGEGIFCRLSEHSCTDTKKCTNLITIPKSIEPKYIMGVDLANGIDWNHM